MAKKKKKLAAAMDRAVTDRAFRKKVEAESPAKKIRSNVRAGAPPYVPVGPM
jgi:hypothetical protein